jgi:hypothetical protein
MASSCLCYSNTPHAVFANNGMVWVSVPKITHMLQSQRVVTWLCNPLNSQLSTSANTESSKCWLESLHRYSNKVLGGSGPILSNGKRQVSMNTTDSNKIQSSKYDSDDVDITIYDHDRRGSFHQNRAVERNSYLLLVANTFFLQTPLRTTHTTGSCRETPNDRMLKNGKMRLTGIDGYVHAIPISSDWKHRLLFHKLG